MSRNFSSNAGSGRRLLRGEKLIPIQSGSAAVSMSAEAPRWLCVDVRFVRKTRLVGLSELRGQPALATMQILQRGNRLSITPVSAGEWAFITENLL